VTDSLLPDAAWRRTFRRRLLAWYANSARDLPWRGTRDPYAIWVSEVMLQQTQVATVLGYFPRFLRAFPTVEALAAADEHDVLRQWEGLGYYRRARQLHQAARILTEQYGGEFPRNSDALRGLPGIGRYTAGAVLSIAFDLPEPILEANTIRLFSRVLAQRSDPAAPAAQRRLWAMAEAVLPQRDAGRFNQSLMELGSEVCLARTPRCDACPIAALCRANIQGVQAEIPPPKSRRPALAVREAAVVVRRRGRVLLLRHPDGVRWAGLWDFPRFPVHSGTPADLHRELAENVRRLTGVVVVAGEHLETLKHSVTRFRITLDCYEAAYVSSASPTSPPPTTRWVRPAELPDYALNTTGRKLARLLSGLLVGYASA
jgi:A/G-specific adenine glycosylase